MLTLASITRGDAIKPVRAVIHGTHGIGKTTFAAGAPSPIFIRSEDGLGLLDVPAFPPAESYRDVLDALVLLLKEEHTYRTLVVDTLDWLEALVWERTCQEQVIDNIEAPGYGKGYVFADEFWDKFIRGFDALRNKKGMSVILLCHSEIKRFDAPDTAPYDRFQMKLQKRANARFAEWADLIGFAHYETIVKEADVGFNKTVARGVGTGSRLLHVEARPAWEAKNRYSLPPSLPLRYDALREALATSVAAAKSANTPTEEVANAV